MRPRTINKALLSLGVILKFKLSWTAVAFVEVIKNNQVLQQRIKNTVKLRRLRTLCEIVNRRISDNFNRVDFLNMLLDEKKEKNFYSFINKLQEASY